MKKIVFVIESLAGGGAERVVSILANDLARSGYDISILMIFEDVVKYHIDSKVNLKGIELEKPHGLRRNIERLQKIRNEINKIKPDVVISFLSLVNIATISSLLLTKYPIILSERNDPKHEPASGKERLLRNLLYSLREKNYFVFQTEYAKKCFPKRIQRKITIIYNPLRTDLHDPYVGLRKNTIVCVARLQPDKNISLLLHAFARFHKKIPSYFLEIYGEGPLLDQLKKECKELEINHFVIFKGFVNNVDEMIVDSSMFVLPSNYEGISNAMIEAMAIGIPTISTDSPAYGARSFIKNGENGFLIGVNNEEELYNRMVDIAENLDLTNKFSCNAAKIRETLDEKIIKDQWIDFINICINSGDV